MLLSRHVLSVIKDQVNFKAEKLEKTFDENKDINADKELVSKYIGDYIKELLEHLLTFFAREERVDFFNQMAKQYNIKIKDEYQEKVPM